MNIKTIWLGLLVAVSLPSCANQSDIAKQPPVAASPAKSRAVAGETDLSAFLPIGAALRLSAFGDVDADGDDDVLVVYTPRAATVDAPRALLVLLRDVDGILRQSVTSSNAVLCRNCGGMMGDPLQQIRIGRGEFTLHFEGGSREIWSSEFRFEYVPDRGTWALAEVIFSGLDRIDGKAAERREGPSDFSYISLEQFDAASFPADVLP